MDGLIADILTYSRLTREEITLRPTSLETVVDQVLANSATLLEETEAGIAVERPLPAVNAHRPTLTQAVDNLISNAVKFVSPGTRPDVRIRAERRAGMVRLMVEDNGVGIDPAHRERIFRPFERLHGVESYPGTGIGLAIVRRSAERMGGTCGVEPNPAGGSRFWIELHVAPETSS
jgi:signal transduction histidine kinase